ncbi:MAG TPA: LysR family transcriptional regulator [Burkholderiaceae bacterium]|nr:LysR family transcriptional regulator [Burkholderiaceae bacterium]
MDLQQIRYFVAVADSGGFTRGAQLAFATQSTLSSAIARLEHELGTALFVRSPRGVSLTHAGERLLARSRVILKEVALAREELRERRACAAPRLRVAVLNTVPMSRLAPALQGMHSHRSGLRLSLMEAGCAEIGRLFDLGRIDLAINVLGADPTRLHERELFTDCLRLALPRGASEAHGSDMQELARWPLVVRTHCEQLSRTSRLLERHRIRPRVLCRTRSDERAVALVAHGMGACFMPDSFAPEGVRFVSIDGVSVERRIGLQWPVQGRQGAVSQMCRELADAPG